MDWEQNPKEITAASVSLSWVKETQWNGSDVKNTKATDVVLMLTTIIDKLSSISVLSDVNKLKK